MYDAASAGVRLTKTGPDCRSSDCTATRPRSASVVVRGCQPELTEVAVAAAFVAELVVVGRFSTRAYQYQTATRRMMMTRQPALFRQPFMACFGRLRMGENTQPGGVRQRGGRRIHEGLYWLPGPPRSDRPPSPSPRLNPGVLMLSGSFAHCAGVSRAFASLIA